MALQLAMNTEFGVNAPNAYIKIENIYGNKDQLQVQLIVYYDENARKEGMTAIKQDNISIPTDELKGDIFPAAYEALKTMADYKDAVDA
jgi:hypothetical protein